MKNLKKAQGSLEYLIIIAGVLIVSGLTIYLVTGSAGQQKKEIAIQTCRQAAAECDLHKSANPNSPCNFCEEQCTFKDGSEIFNGSIKCCELGQEDMIYQGSPGCQEHTLTMNVDGNGSTTPSEGNHTYLGGKEVTLTANPDTGWYFGEWTGDHTGTQKKVNITMDSDKNIKAIFEETQGPTIDITSPEENDTWLIGEEENITWTTTEGTASIPYEDSIKLELFSRSPTMGDVLVESFWTNNTGIYSSVIPSGVSEGSYFVRATVVDESGLNYTDETGLFKIIDNDPPYVEDDSERPPNGTTEVSSDNTIYLNVTVSDPDLEEMNVTFYAATDDTEGYLYLGEDLNVPDGSQATIPVGGYYLNTSTTYNWYVNVTDGRSITKSEIWSFTTEEENQAPYVVDGSEEPQDGARGVPYDSALYVNVTVVDPDGDQMDVEFYENSYGSLGTIFNVPNGSQASIQVGSSYIDPDTTYNWHVDVLDGETTTTSDTWNFTTQISSGISNCEELQNMSNDLSGDYQLATDIDCNGFDFEPIDEFSSEGISGCFNGSFDGRNFTISNLHIDKGEEDYVGLFGCTGTTEDGADITDVGLENVDITGNDDVGSLVGFQYEGTVSGCYATGSVAGSNYVGGLIGNSDDDVLNSYSMVSVDGNDKVGGLVGGSGQNIVSKCYATGSVSSSGSAGGLIGDKTVNSDCSSSFWDVDETGQGTSAGCNNGGKTTSEMKDVDTFTNESTVGLDNAWDFVGHLNDDSAGGDIWNIDSINDGYPYLCDVTDNC